MLHEQSRVLIERTVIGVGIQNQRRIWDVLLHRVRVHGRCDDVVVPLYDQGGLADIPQIVEHTVNCAPYFPSASI
jgi:hypothetical protein